MFNLYKRNMSVATINATKTARQIQLYQTFICESIARKAFFSKRTSVHCSWLTTKSSLWIPNTAFHLHLSLLRKRIVSLSVITVPKRSSFIICPTLVNKSTKFLSSVVNVRYNVLRQLFVSTQSWLSFLEKMGKPNEFQRLPLTVVPKHYNLELKPDLIGFTFTGKTSIKIQLLTCETLQPTSANIKALSYRHLWPSSGVYYEMPNDLEDGRETEEIVVKGNIR